MVTQESTEGVATPLIDYVPPSVTCSDKGCSRFCDPGNLVVYFQDEISIDFPKVTFAWEIPQVTAQAVSFTDSNPLVGTVSGIIDITRASNENGIASALGVSNGCPKKNSTVKPMKCQGLVQPLLCGQRSGVGADRETASHC